MCEVAYTSQSLSSLIDKVGVKQHLPQSTAMKDK